MKYSACILLLFCCLFNYAQTPDLELQLFASGLDKPVNIKNTGSFDTNLYVVEQDGRIKIIDASGTLLTQNFLDIDDRVGDLDFPGDERGLLGLAFHPNYANNGYFYVNYINNSGNTVVSRFTRNMSNPLVADSSSELIIITYSQPFSNHNGGDLAFGSDNYLYIASGDGGAGGDPGNRAQDLTTFLGKMLRLDVDNPSNGNNYGIPPNNPFIGNSSALDEIWAYGLRNPSKFSFDRMNGDIWIADVGQNQIEEIDKASATESGLNYGWRCYEGNSEFDTSTNCPNVSELTFPVAQYNHSNGRCSITGGYLYRGLDYPNFQGLYFFADYCSQDVGYIQYDNIDDEWDMTLEQFTGNWTAFDEDSNGEVYVASINAGEVFKLIDVNVLGTEEQTLNSISIFPNPSKEKLNIDFSTYNSSITSISIIDLQGKLIKSIQRNSEAIQTISLTDASKGLYIVEIENDEGNRLTRKLAIN